MKNRKLDLIIGILFIAALSLGISAQSASTGTVSATVTAQNLSLSVSDGSVAYGTVPIGSVSNTLVAGLNDLQTVTNDGNITEDFNIKGADSANWTLASNTSSANYSHQFSTTTGSFWNYLSTSYATLTTTKAANATATFDLQIQVPTSPSVYTQQSVNVTVQAVAT